VGEFLEIDHSKYRDGHFVPVILMALFRLRTDRHMVPDERHEPCQIKTSCMFAASEFSLCTS
jgi:hypothetical protein